MRRTRSAAAAALLMVLATSAAFAAVIDCGAGGKAKILDRLNSIGKARIQYRSNDAPCIAKGPGGDPADLSGTFQILYVDDPGSVEGAFVMPSPWYLNEDQKAKYLNVDAPNGPGQARLVGIRPAIHARFGSRGLGDGPAFDLSSPPGPNGVLAIVTLNNDIDGNTYRVCTRWAQSVGSNVRYDIIDGGLGRKLLLERGVVGSCNVVPTTTSTSSSVPTTTSTSSTTTTSTSSTTIPVLPLRFTTGAAGGTCGETRTGGAGGTIIKTLTCGGLNVGGGCFQGGGSCGVPEGPTPSGADTFFNATCSAGTCSVTARTAAQTGSSNNCSNTGCKFGPPLSIANGGTSTCVLNTFSSPASGTLTTPGGDFTGGVPLTSTVTVTGNNANPCPNCTPQVGPDTCDGTASNPGATCTAINAALDSYDCLPSGIGLTPFGVNLTPISTNTETKNGPGGVFCPGQDGTEPGSFGCFDSGPTTVCDYIEERGADAAGITSGGAAVSGRLASIFCIPATGNGLIDGAADLPGPGAVTLPGTFELN